MSHVITLVITQAIAMGKCDPQIIVRGGLPKHESGKHRSKMVRSQITLPFKEGAPAVLVMGDNAGIHAAHNNKAEFQRVFEKLMGKTADGNGERCHRIEVEVKDLTPMLAVKAEKVELPVEGL